MIQPGEDTRCLEVPLHAHQFKHPPEQRRFQLTADRFAETLIEHLQPLVDLLSWPTHVAVLEQGDEVVTERTLYRILEVEYARVVPIGDHQVS